MFLNLLFCSNVISTYNQFLVSLFQMIFFVLFSMFPRATFQTPLINAVRSGSTDEVRRLINIGVNVNETDHTRKDALTYAIIAENSEILNLLIAAGADPNRYDDMGCTPLIGASIQGNFELVRNLVAAKVDLNRKSSPGRITAVHTSSSAGELEISNFSFFSTPQVLPNYSPSYTPLTLALGNRNFKIAEFLIFSGADFNQPLGLFSRDIRERLNVMIKSYTDMVESKINFVKFCDYVKEMSKDVIFDVIADLNLF